MEEKFDRRDRAETFIIIHSCRGFTEQLPFDLDVGTWGNVSSRQYEAAKPMALSFQETARNSVQNFGY